MNTYNVSLLGAFRKKKNFVIPTYVIATFILYTSSLTYLYIAFSWLQKDLVDKVTPSDTAQQTALEQSTEFYKFFNFIYFSKYLRMKSHMCVVT